jgi:beta-phosphoglucomutase-like phosphatase (HAD superfamily)
MSEWIVFEDSYSGLKAANNAGVDVVWIKDLAILMDDNVDYIQEHNSLLDVLNDINFIQSL